MADSQRAASPRRKWGTIDSRGGGAVRLGAETFAKVKQVAEFKGISFAAAAEELIKKGWSSSDI
jgi:hypothetical protein